jgi:ABC-type transport system involved in multi-copper enzyme maturation permease subunit
VRGTTALLRHSARRYRPLLIGICALLFGFQILLILVGRGLEQAGGFAQLENLIPDMVRQWTNIPALSFRGLVSFAYSHPVVLVSLMGMAIALGTEPAGEVESGFADLVLARRVPRGAVIHRSLLLLLTATVAGVGSMMAGTWTGLVVLAPAGTPSPEAGVIVALAVNLALAVIAWGSIALLIGSLARRRGAAAGGVALLAFAAFVIDAVGRLWAPMRGVALFSPFHYFSPFPLIAGAPLPWRDVIVLASVAVLAAAGAHVAYARRDL